MRGDAVAEPKKPKPTELDEPFDWDADTDVLKIPKPSQHGGLPSVADDDGMTAQDLTARHAPSSVREQYVGAALPRYVQARIEVMGGPSARDPFDVTMVRTMIGRGPAADLRIKDTNMSKRHATIFFADGEFRIRDEKSTNGTFLNGSKVVEYAIRDGDKVLVGDTLLRFRVTKR